MILEPIEILHVVRKNGRARVADMIDDRRICGLCAQFLDSGNATYLMAVAANCREIRRFDIYAERTCIELGSFGDTLPELL